MPSPRNQIEKVKDELRRNIERKAVTFRRSIIREIDRMYRELGGTRDVLERLIDLVDREFTIKLKDKKLFADELALAQRQIAELWNEYFEGELREGVQLSPGDYENLLALSQVDFPEIQDEQRDMIIQELRRAVRSDYSFDTVRSRLIKRGLSAHHASTLTNTGIAQFDNALMHEYSAQAGIEDFLYDGVLQRNSRQFCIEHLGNTYTIAQIKAMNNGQGLPVLSSLGGYNCTHWWTPQVDKRRPSRRRTQAAGQAPLGVKVGAALDLTVTDNLRRSFDEVIASIDTVHGDGNLPRIPVEMNHDRHMLGAFWFDQNKRPLKITISKRGNRKEFALAHEIGHFIDLAGSGNTTVYSSEDEDAFAGWRKAVHASSAFKTLEDLKGKTYVDVVGGDGSTIRFPVSRRYLLYLTSDRELWARTYAQYVATKGGNKKLQTQLKRLLDEETKEVVKIPTQWSEEEFEPIAREIENAFRRIGWIQ